MKQTNRNQKVGEHHRVPLCEESDVVSSKMGHGRDTGTSWASVILPRAALIIPRCGGNFINIRKNFPLPTSVESNPHPELSFLSSMVDLE